MPIYSPFTRYSGNSLGASSAPSERVLNDWQWTGTGIEFWGTGTLGGNSSLRATSPDDAWVWATAGNQSMTISLANVESTTQNNVHVGAGFRFENSASQGVRLLSLYNGSNYYSFGINGGKAAIYVNGSVAATSTVDVMRFKRYIYVEIEVEKLSGNVYLAVNGTRVATASSSAMTGDMQSAEVAFGLLPRTVRVSSFKFEAAASSGPIRIASFLSATRDVDTGWTGSSSGASTPPSASQYVEATGAAERRYTYSAGQVIKADMPFTAIKAVVYNAVASAGTGGANLHLTTTQGTTQTSDFDASSYVTANGTAMTGVWSVLTTNPSTTAAWASAAEVESTKTSVKFS